MSVSLTFTCDSQVLTEANPLNFSTVQAGVNSSIKTVNVINTGTSDAQNCRVDPVAATVANGFSADIQAGTAQETYQAQKFAATENATTWYNFAVLGTGKNYTTGTAGTLVNTTGSDSFATYWAPPASGTAGDKVWGNKASCQYVY